MVRRRNGEEGAWEIRPGELGKACGWRYGERSGVREGG